MNIIALSFRNHIEVAEILVVLKAQYLFNLNHNLLKNILISLSLTLFSLSIFAQGDVYLINVKVQLVDITTNEPVPYANVINPRIHGGTTSNSEGIFSIQILTEDTLLIRSIGYQDFKLSINDVPPKSLYTIKLNPIVYQIGEISVKSKKNDFGLPSGKVNDIPVQLRGDAFNEKPPLIAALFMPLSFMQYYLSKNEKSKRETRAAILTDNQWSVFSQYYNREAVERLTGLGGDDTDSFMIYFNLNNKLPYWASQIEIEMKIMELYFKYKKNGSKPFIEEQK